MVKWSARKKKKKKKKRKKKTSWEAIFMLARFTIPKKKQGSTRKLNHRVKCMITEHSTNIRWSSIMGSRVLNILTSKCTELLEHLAGVSNTLTTMLSGNYLFISASLLSVHVISRKIERIYFAVQC